MKKLFIFLLALLPMTLMAQDNPVVKSLFEEPETRYLKMKQKEHLKALDNKFKKALKNGKQADGCYHVEKLCRGGDKLYKEQGVNFFGVPYREALEYAEHYNYKIIDFEPETWEGTYHARGNKDVFVRNLRFVLREELAQFEADVRAKKEAEEKQAEQESNARKEMLADMASNSAALKAYPVSDWKEGYAGETDAKGKPQGKGVLCWTYSDGRKARFEGYFDKGEPGDGTHQGVFCIWKNDILRYVGISNYICKKEKNRGYRVSENGRTEYFESPSNYFYGTCSGGQLTGVKVDVFNMKMRELVNDAETTSGVQLDETAQKAVKKNKPVFLEVWKDYAEKGQGTMPFTLGNMYLTGTVVEKDSAMAAHYFVLAVENPDIRSKKYDELKSILCGKYESLRNNFSKKYIDAAYAADYMWWVYVQGTNLRKKSYGLDGTAWGPFEDSYRKGHPKAVKLITNWAAAGHSQPKRLIAEYDSLGDVLKKQYNEMESVVKSTKFSVPNMNLKALDLFESYKGNDPKNYGEYASMLKPFVFVTYVYNQDFEKREYGVKRYGALYISYGRGKQEIDSLKAAVRICKSQTNSEYGSYYKQCLPLIQQKLDRLPKLVQDRQEAFNEDAKEFDRKLDAFIEECERSARAKIWGKYASSSRSSSSSSSSSQKTKEDDIDVDVVDESKVDHSINPETVEIPESDVYDTETIKNLTGKDDTRYLICFKIGPAKWSTSYTYIADSKEYKCRNGLYYKNEEDAKAAAYVWERYWLIRKKGAK